MESAPPRGRALALSMLAALGTGLLSAVLSAVFNLHLGLLVVAAFGGWLIGSPLRAAGPRRVLFAVAFAGAAVAIASIVDFVISQVLLPASNIPLAERLAAARYVEYTAGTFDVVSALSVVILVVVAWRSAR